MWKLIKINYGRVDVDDDDDVDDNDNDKDVNKDIKVYIF